MNFWHTSGRLPRACWLVSLTCWLAASAGVGDDWRPVGATAAETKIREGLADATTMEFIETPLTDVVDFLKDLHGLEMQIDQQVLERAGIERDAPVTVNLKGISLASALNLVLRDLKLSYVVRDEVILITTFEESERLLSTQIYNVEKLISAEHSIDKLTTAVSDALGRRISMPPIAAHEIVEGKKPEEPAPLARGISSYRHFLIVTDSDAGHRAVQRLLHSLGTGLQVPAENDTR